MPRKTSQSSEKKRKRLSEPAPDVSAAPAQSLSALLLGQGDRDAELDALFSATPAPIAVPSKPVTAFAPPRKPEDFLGKRAAQQDAGPPAKRVKKVAAPVVEPEESSEDDEEDEGAEEDEDEESDEDDERPIVHESLLPGYEKTKAAKGTKRARQTAEEEDPAVRDARTVFVGNVPVVCAAQKKSRKAFINHVLSLLGDQAGKIESVRFRGLAPAAPVVKGKIKEAVDTVPHGRARAAAFRERGGLLASTADDEDDETARAQHKKQVFQTEAQKRKVNYIKGEVHGSVDACLAYIVFDTNAAVDALVAISGAVLATRPFEGKVLRFDRLRSTNDSKPAPYEPPRDETKRTAFLGGLDFAQSEQSVRDWAEAAIVKERGQPENGMAWVERIRLVRDRETGMGKGFAYVLFSDSECVDELLALEPQHLKLSKRKIRVERCASKAKLDAQRSVAAKAVARKQSSAANAVARVTSSSRSSRPGKSKPAPSLEQRAKAERLSGLDKETRKATKASDADRIARRLEKKKAKVVEARRTRKAISRRTKA